MQNSLMSQTHTILLELPPGSAREALENGVRALGAVSTFMPAAPRDRNALLRSLADYPNTLVVLDTSPASPSAAHISELDTSLPKHANHAAPTTLTTRARVLLMRMDSGVSRAEVQWARTLGFAGLFGEFEPNYPEGELRAALDCVADLIGAPKLDAAELTACMLAERTSGHYECIRHDSGMSPESLANALYAAVPPRELTYRFRSYPDCVTGTEVVVWLCRHFNLKAPRAVQLGDALLALGWMHHVAHEHAFQNKHLFYQLAVSSAADALDMSAVITQLRGATDLVQDRSYRGTSFPKCFVGSEAVAFLCKAHSLTRHAASVFLQRVWQFCLIEHVTQEHPFIDGNFYYRFLGDAP